MFKNTIQKTSEEDATGVLGDKRSKDNKMGSQNCHSESPRDRAQPSETATRPWLPQPGQKEGKGLLKVAVG